MLPRFWRRRGSDLRQVEDPAHNPRLQETGAATRGPCTVLLGPPGSGKTTALRMLAEGTPERVRVISFGSTGSEERLRDLVSRAVEALGAAGARGTEKPLLALDSLDEASLTTTWPPQGLERGSTQKLGPHRRVLHQTSDQTW